MKFNNTLIQIIVIILVNLITKNSFGQNSIPSDKILTLGARFQVSNEFLLFSEIDSGQAGPNRTYNLSNLQNGPLVDTLSVVLPAQAPGGNPFPASNRVLLRNFGKIDSWYFAQDQNELRSLGNLGGPSIPPYFRLPFEKLAKFPMEYGDTASGRFYSPLTFFVGTPLQTPYIVDSVRRRTTTVYRWKIDGWGQVITPLGSFPCLRQRIWRQIKDTADFLRADLNIWVNQAEIQSTEEVHFWYWTPDFPFPVARLGDLGWNGFINDVEFVKQNLITSVMPENEMNIGFQIYPNPGKEGFFWLKQPSKGKAEMDIFSLDGKHIRNLEIQEIETRIELHDIGQNPILIKVRKDGKNFIFRHISE